MALGSAGVRSDASDTFAKLLRAHAAVRGARAAFRHKDFGLWRTWSWAEVYRESRAIAVGLIALGLDRGDTIAIVGANRANMQNQSAQWLDTRRDKPAFLVLYGWGAMNPTAKVSFLLTERNTNIALRYASFGYILETGRVVLDGAAEALRSNEDVREFYLGVAGDNRRSFKHVKTYKRRKRWLA